MAPCSAEAFIFAAVQLIPFESVRYNPNRRRARVTGWIAESKSFAMQDSMLVQVAAVAAAKKRGAGEELWTRLITVGSLSKQEALTAWSASTWSIYKRSLVEMRWGVKLADGGLQWIGPQDATFTQLHQYRMKDRVR